METENLQTLPPPPGVIDSLKAGFDAIATNIALILFPVGLDLLLWLGPRLHVKELFAPVLTALSKNYAASGLEVEQLTAIQILLDSFTAFLENFNLLSMVRTFPIGIFSLMSGIMPSDTPLGTPIGFQLKTEPAVMLWTGIFVFVGWILGGLFFQQVANRIKRTDEKAPVKAGLAIGQTILFSLLSMAVSFSISVPLLFVVVRIASISPMLAQGIFLVFAALSMWLIVPFFFMPHGMFMEGQNVFVSIFSSLRLARFTLPTSSLFVLSVLLLSIGMNFLWAIPAPNSWMTLVGIAGHAFVSTSLLAASFIYYRNITAWLQTVLDKIKNAVPAQQA
ncbi:MAG: hypothetical protein Kow002_03420 [Anaerolineales bacterium]